MHCKSPSIPHSQYVKIAGPAGQPHLLDELKIALYLSLESWREGQSLLALPQRTAAKRAVPPFTYK